MSRDEAADAAAPQGLVIRVDSRLCRVRTDEGQDVDCRVRGLLFREQREFDKPVAAGDRVRLKMQRTEPHMISGVLPRRNALSRPKRGGRQIIASNLDRALLTLACTGVHLNVRLLDRMLVACEREGFQALIVLNKVDLVADRSLLAPFLDLYEPLGYPVLTTSALTGEGLDELAKRLGHGISIFAGMSGVGKSALLTAIKPDLRLRSADVSESSGKGRHTTTSVSLLELAPGAWVVDTPGIREFGIHGLEPHEIGRCFVEFRPFVGRCRFRTCTHDHEVACAVKEAVEQGEIDELRYDSYLRILKGGDET